MGIQVTPIPRLTVLTVPAFTLGTANAAGAADTSIASDSTLLVFDTSDPAAIGTSAVVGSATTATRRDHVHAGIGGAGTVVDDAITRFNGTGGLAVQGYSSLSPTVSDAGIISLTSGALKFPATAIASGDATTLDDYREGSWTPSLTFGGGNTGMSYASQVGSYTKIGNFVFCQGSFKLSDKGSSTGNAKVEGLPFATGSSPLPPVVLTVKLVSYDAYPNGLVAGSLIELGETSAGGTYNSLTNAHFADTSEIFLSLLYKI
jgi:hypothetical protein